MRSGSRLGRRRAIAVLFVLAGVAAATTAIVATSLTPHGTVDLDEVAYTAQANTLAEHHLTLPAATHDPFFRPFLSGVRGGRVVFKYQPEWPALIAAARGVFGGSSLPLRMLLSIGGVLAVAWFAWELTGDVRVALLAAALVVLSPFAWVQSASLLGYQLSFVVGTAAAAALLRTLREPSVRASVGAGALLGLAILHRPFDALLATAPVLVYWCWMTVRGRERLRRAVWLGVGGFPFAVLFFAYNRAVMGSLTRLAYNVTGPSDTFGFGRRSSFTIPGRGNDGRVDYTVARAVSTLGHLVVVLPRFVAFAPVVAVAVVVAARARRRDARIWLLVAMIAVVVVGYFFWWGVSNSYHFHLDRSLGPFYYYPVLAPLCVLAAWGVVSFGAVSWRSRSRPLIVGAVVVGLAWAGAASFVVVRDARDAGLARTAEVTLLHAPAPALVLEAPQFPGDPYLRVATDARLRAPDLVAVDVADRRFALLDRFPGRTPYMVRSYQSFGDAFGPELHDRVELHVVRAPVIEVGVTARLDAGRVGTVYLRVGDGPAQLSTSATGTITASFRVTATELPPGARETTLAVGVAIAAPGERAPRAVAAGREWIECDAQARATADGNVELLMPCDGRHHYVFPDGASATTSEDVSTRVQLRTA